MLSPAIMITNSSVLFVANFAMGKAQGYRAELYFGSHVSHRARPVHLLTAIPKHRTALTASAPFITHSTIWVESSAMQHRYRKRT